MKRFSILLFIVPIIATVVLTFGGEVAHADSPGPFGLGLVIGEPTGLSMNYKLSSERSIDGAFAWNFSPYAGFEFHGDYLWHRNNLFRISTTGMNLHYGIGGRLLFANARNNESARTYLGPRIPVGINTNFNQKAIEVFTEIALVMNLIPGTSADFDFGIGARVYF